jgi:ribosomal protein S18 acetylase RimI-like enzyme
LSASLRKATAEDLPSIRDIVATAYGKYLDRMDRPPAPMLRDYSGAVDAGDVWVAGDPVTGLISLTQTGGSLLIENVAVHPSAQGTGLGRRLMEFAEQQATGRGLRSLTLYTNEVMTENLAIYTRLGYREKGRQTEDGYRRVYMEKILPGI